MGGDQDIRSTKATSRSGSRSYESGGHREDERPNAVDYAPVGLWGPQETVKHIARIDVGSGDRAGRVDGRRGGALPGTCAGARGIERGDTAVRSAHEAVSHIARVDVEPFNRSCLVDAAGHGALVGACARARNIERGDSAVRGAHEAVSHIARVIDLSHDHPCRVYNTAVSHKGAQAGTCARTGRIERGDSTVRGAHEAVKGKAYVSVNSRDDSRWVDAKADGAERSRTWSIEARDGAVGSSHVAMTNVAVVHKIPRGRSR